jgi:transcriptional regulator with XRE-family HTH domain
MTPKQLRAALARIGLSQREAARRLGIDERTMRKYVAGDLVIPQMLVWALCGLLLADPDQPPFEIRRHERKT